MNSYHLRLKITLLLSLVFLLAFALQGSLVSNYLQQIYLQKLNQEQSHRLETMVTAIDIKLANTLATLKMLAQSLPKEQINNVEALQQWLSGHNELLLTYDNGMFVFDAKGNLVVEAPFRPDRRGRDYSFRPYFQQAARTLQPLISDPYISTLDHGHKTIMMAVPVLDGRGQLLAILGGSIDLMQENFLGRLSQQRLGEQGFFFMAGMDRSIIVHPDSEKFPEQRIDQGMSAIFDMAISGFEGCTVGANCQGEPVLFAVKRLKNKEWVLCSVLPLEELLGPLRQGRFALWGIIGATTALILIVVVLALRWVFRPLFLFSAHLLSLPDKKGAQRAFAYAGDDELSLLINTFNATLREMDATRAALNHAQKMAHIGSWQWDVRSGVLVWSDEVYRIFGEQPQAYSASYASFLNHVHPDDRPALEQAVAAALKGTVPYALQHRIVLSNDKIRHVQEQGEVHCDEQGEPLAMVGTVQDITDQVLLLNRLNELATTDELTGTMNRRQLILMIERELSRLQRYGSAASLLFFDLDHFKKVNDHYGHQIGDKALRHVCDVVRLQLRDSDSFGRYGGEEFCVLLPGSTNQSAFALAERIRLAVAQTPMPLEPDGESPATLAMTISIGITGVRADETSTVVLERADRAVYQAKEQGRNCSVML